jgi:hypothetical protein
MALSGSFTLFNPHPTDTEIISYSIVYPADIPEDNSLYEKRGTTEIISSSQSIQVPTTYDNQYLILRNISINKSPTEYDLSYEYSSYNSVENSKNLDVSPNFKGNGILEWDFDLNVNPYEEAYTYLSSSFLSSSITNV